MAEIICSNRSGSSERLKMGPIGPARGSSALFGVAVGPSRIDSGRLETRLGPSQVISAWFGGAVGPSRMNLGRLETRLGAARGGWALPAHGWGLNHTFARML